MLTNYKLLFILVFAGFGAFGQNAKISFSDILLLDSSSYLYQAGRFYISGQPDDSIFLALKGGGLQLVINIRTVEEMEALKKEGFDERVYLDSLGVKYINIPMGGKIGYSPDMILDIDKGIKNADGEVMIHCRSAGRATYAFVAWLINYQNTSVDDAVTIGKKMRLRFTVEDLLGYDLFYGKRE